MPRRRSTWRPSHRRSVPRRRGASPHPAGRPAGVREPDLGEDRTVRARRFFVVHLSHVVRHDDAGDRAGGLRDANGPVDQVRSLLRDHQDLDELVRHVLVQADEVNLLLVVAPKAHALLLADDRHHWLVVESGVVETVEEVDGAGTGGSHAHAYLAGEFRVGARRERRYLLVGRLGELDPVADLVEGPEQPVDAVTGITVDPLHAPVGEAVEHKLRYVGHRNLPTRCSHTLWWKAARSRPGANRDGCAAPLWVRPTR